MPGERMEKVYLAKFMNYTNCMNDTVSNGDKDISKREYIEVGCEPFLIRESELSKYSKYGGGYRELIVAGNMLVEDET